MVKRIRKCGLLGGTVLLGEGFAISEAQVKSSGSLFLLLMDLDVELSASYLQLLNTSPNHYPSLLSSQGNDEGLVLQVVML